MRALPKASISALKPNPPKVQQTTMPKYTMPTLQQNMNTTQHVSRQAAQAIPKPQTPQNPPLNMALPFRETRSSSTHQNRHMTFNQEAFTRHWSILLHPQGRLHSKLSKMKRRKNMQQVRKYGKNPPDQTNEEEIQSLPEREFRMITVKMIQNLE